METPMSLPRKCAIKFNDAMVKIVNGTLFKIYIKNGYRIKIKVNQTDLQLLQSLLLLI